MTEKCVQLQQLESELNKLLKPWLFKDYCPNGLQVEGKSEVGKLVTGVTASLDFIEAAIVKKADALLVHHGYFWHGEDQSIAGLKKARIQKLLANDVSLFAYHLPLDMHQEFGNNVQLGRLLGIEIMSQVGKPGEPELVHIGKLSEGIHLQELSELVADRLERQPLIVAGSEKVIDTIGWCTGAAQNYFELAINSEVDAFITGEISEPSAHLARESGIHFISAGHHATERYGVQAVGNHLEEKLELVHEFIDIDNPA